MGRIRVGPQAIREYLGRMRERYAHAARPTKGVGARIPHPR